MKTRISVPAHPSVTGIGRVSGLVFSRGQATLYEALSVRPSVGRLVGRSVGRSVVIELESVKTRISAPAHPSATGIGRVSGLVRNEIEFCKNTSFFFLL